MSGFSNAVIGGAEILIRSAIRSVNYIAGVAGWRISRDGDVDLNGGTFRGTVIVTNPSGSFVELAPGATNAVINIQPPDNPNPIITYTPSQIFSDALAANRGGMFLTSPVVSISGIPVGDNSSISILSETSTGIDSEITLQTDQVNIGTGGQNAAMLHPATGTKYLPSVFDTVAFSVPAGATSQAIVFNFPASFPAGSVPIVFCTVITGSGASALWMARPIAINDTQVNISVRNTANIPVPAGPNLALSVQYMAFLPQ